MNNLRDKMRGFQTHKHFDEDLPIDVEEVLDVAAALDIKEFEVFRLAYDWWHGEASTEAEIEPIFVRYMFNSAVPPWVRQFTRMALRLRDEDELDPDAFGVQRQPADAKMVSQGIRYSVMLVMILGALFMLAYLSRDLILTYAYCMFPPCY
ncbi:MAG: hypothetical protein OES46_14160 [Gammaproteobacteria bacterium]|nr:hypothetical protein [Gammaproteobacteria bacterium]